MDNSGLRAVTDRDIEMARHLDAFINSYRNSPASRRSVASALTSTAKRLSRNADDACTFPWEGLANAEVFDASRRNLEEGIEAAGAYAERGGVSAATADRYMAVAMAFLVFLARRGFIDWGKLEAARLNKPRIHRTKPLGRRLLRSEVTELLAAAHRQPNKPKAARDCAMLALLAGTGARRSELANINYEHLTDEPPSVYLPRVKGGGDRTALIPRTAKPYLDQWVSIRGTSPGPLFNKVLKNGAVEASHRLSDQTIWWHIRQLAERTGLGWEPTPHDFRRFFVTDLLDSGIDVLAVARLVGHRSPYSTQRYDRRGPEDLRHHLERLDIPSPDDLEALLDDDPTSRVNHDVNL